MNNSNSSSEVGDEKPMIAIPDIDALRCRPFLQSLASRDAWVTVQFFKDEPVTKAEIYRTIELLCLIHNGWS